MRCPKSRFPIWIIVFDELELIIFVSQGLTLSTASLVNPFFLSYKLNQMVFHVKKANPGIEVHDITIEDVRQFLDEKGKKPIIDKRIRRLIEDYVNIKNSM